MAKQKYTERERWMQAFEKRVLEMVPEFAGKIEWDSAVFFFNQRQSPDTAAERYVTSRES